MGNPGTGTIRSRGRLRAEERRAGETDTESVIPLGCSGQRRGRLSGNAGVSCICSGCAVW